MDSVEKGVHRAAATASLSSMETYTHAQEEKKAMSFPGLLCVEDPPWCHIHLRKKRRVTILHFKLHISSSGTSHFSAIPGRSPGAFGGEDPDFLSSLL